MEVNNDEKWKEFRKIVTKCVKAHPDHDIDEIIALEMGDERHKKNNGGQNLTLLVDHLLRLWRAQRKSDGSSIYDAFIGIISKVGTCREMTERIQSWHLETQAVKHRTVNSITQAVSECCTRAGLDLGKEYIRQCLEQSVGNGYSSDHYCPTNFNKCKLESNLKRPAIVTVQNLKKIVLSQYVSEQKRYSLCINADTTENNQENHGVLNYNNISELFQVELKFESPHSLLHKVPHDESPPEKRKKHNS